MKKNIFFLIGCFCLAGFPVLAQSTLESEQLASTKNLRFEFTANYINQFDFGYSKAKVKKSAFLTTAGYLLQGFKFSSPIDQFNATAPFDLRGYQPKDFSSFVSYINDTSLLQQKITPIK